MEEEGDSVWETKEEILVNIIIIILMIPFDMVCMWTSHRKRLAFCEDKETGGS